MNNWHCNFLKQRDSNLYIQEFEEIENEYFKTINHWKFDITKQDFDFVGESDISVTTKSLLATYNYWKSGDEKLEYHTSIFNIKSILKTYTQ